jgi:iron(III) transport system permease protein
LPWCVAFLLLLVAGVFLSSEQRVQNLALNSVLLAAGTCAIALPIATALAVAITRTAVFGRSTVVLLLFTLLFLPLYVQLAGWDALAGKNGWQTLAFGAVDRPLLSGMTAAIWIHAMAAIPWAVLIIGIGLLLVEPELEEAALLDTSPLGVLLTVTLPQTLPFLFVAAVWVGVSTTTEMTVTNIYLVSTYTEELYMSLALSPSLGEAALEVAPGIMAVVLLVLATLLLITWLLSGGQSASLRRQVVLPTGWLQVGISLAVWLVVLALVGVPLFSLVYKAGVQIQLVDGVAIHSWDGQKFAGVIALVLGRFQSEFWWTVVIAASTATATLLLANVLGWLARWGGWRAIPAGVVTALAIAVPGPLVAIAIIGILNQRGSFAIWVYDRTIVGPLLAQMVHASPLALLIVWQAFRSISDETLAAASLDGAGRWTTLAAVAIPQRKAALAAAWLAAFAVSAGDLGYSLLVLPPGMNTIQREIFGLVHSGVEEQVAGVCLVQVLAYLVIAGFLLTLLRAMRRETA